MMKRIIGDRYTSTAEAVVNQAIDALDQANTEGRDLKPDERSLLRRAAKFYEAHTGQKLDLKGL